MMACNETQMYWAFVSGAFMSIMLLWPVLMLAVFAFGRNRPFASERELIINNMKRALDEQSKYSYLHRSPEWVEIRVPESTPRKRARKKPRVAGGTGLPTK